MEPLKLSGRMRTIALDADGRAADPAFDADAVADAIHCYRQWLHCYDLSKAALAAGDHALADVHTEAGDICWERGVAIFHDLDADGQAEVARMGGYPLEWWRVRRNVAEADAYRDDADAAEDFYNPYDDGTTWDASY